MMEVGTLTGQRDSVGRVQLELSDGTMVYARWLPNSEVRQGLPVLLETAADGSLTAHSKSATVGRPGAAQGSALGSGAELSSERFATNQFRGDLHFHGWEILNREFDERNLRGLILSLDASLFTRARYDGYDGQAAHTMAPPTQSTVPTDQAAAHAACDRFAAAVYSLKPRVAIIANHMDQWLLAHYQTVGSVGEGLVGTLDPWWKPNLPSVHKYASAVFDALPEAELVVVDSDTVPLPNTLYVLPNLPRHLRNTAHRFPTGWNQGGKNYSNAGGNLHQFVASVPMPGDESDFSRPEGKLTAAELEDWYRFPTRPLPGDTTQNYQNYVRQRVSDDVLQFMRKAAQVTLVLAIAGSAHSQAWAIPPLSPAEDFPALQLPSAYTVQLFESLQLPARYEERPTNERDAPVDAEPASLAEAAAELRLALSDTELLSYTGSNVFTELADHQALVRNSRNEPTVAYFSSWYSN